MKKVDKILLKQIRPSIGSVVFITTLAFIVVGLNALSPWSFKILIDNVLSPDAIHSNDYIGKYLSLFGSKERLGLFAVLIYFLTTFILSVVEYVSSVTVKKFVKKLTSNFSKIAFRNLESLAIGYYNKQQIGDYIYRMSYDVSAFGELVEDGVLPLIHSFFYLLVTVSIMLFIDVKLTILALLSLPILVFGLHFFNKQIVYTTKRSEFFNSLAFSFIEEALSHLKVIQAFSQEQSESEKFDKKIDASLEGDISYYKLDYFLTLLIGIIIAICYSIVMIYGIHAVFSGALTTGLLIVFIFYLDNLTNPIISIIYAFTEVKKSYVKISRMEEFFSEKKHTQNMGTVRKVSEGGISFRHVTQTIGDVHILNDVSFDIEAGKRTVIFGMNGSGKSSVANLILRFNEPTSGKIYIDGVNIVDYDLVTLRESISFIPQEITLFNETIYDNIAFGSTQATPERVREAARLATADEFIKRNPKKYAFKVGEDGNFLSGGQKQRLMIARALMKDNARVLLFDETFSALDVRTRENVLHNIHMFSENKTTIIISNIFSVISAADNIIVLNKGKVIYHGPAKHLSREVSLYKMIMQNN